MIGGGAPISIQSMISVSTSNVDASVREIKRLQDAGCDIVRLGIPDEESARAIGDIKRQINIPLVADIHFDYRLALISAESGADSLRINPGNLRNADEVKAVARACMERNIPIRIGVNGGSVDRKKYSQVTAEALVDSAVSHIKLLEDIAFRDIKVSLKSSDVTVTVNANRIFSGRYDYPLHLGVTEAGIYNEAVIKSSAGIGALLLDGIGDTIRISITGDSVKEVEAARILLRALGLRREGIEIISCPTCARHTFNVERVADELTRRTGHYKKYMKVAVMGCIVNGPGEAAGADLGVAAAGKEAVLFKNGSIIRHIPTNDILRALLIEIKNYQKSSLPDD
jgi:(E)-4-hydroxy-3-methylbut-2-enyl-diphosphate synthase